MSNGLTNADIGKQQAVGGLFYEFTRRVVKHYQEFDRDRPDAPNVKLCRNGYWYEASVAERLFHEMLAGEGDRIQLLLAARATAGGRRQRPAHGSGVPGRDSARRARRVPRAGVHRRHLRRRPGGDGRCALPRRPRGHATSTTNRTRAASTCTLARPNCCPAPPARPTRPLRASASASTSRRTRPTASPVDKPEDFNRDDYRWRVRRHPLRQGDQRSARSSRSTRCRTASSS